MPESASFDPRTDNPSNCFGCAQHNPIGLRLLFDVDGNGFSTRFTLGPDYESFPGVIHGGIVATILDETLAQAVYRAGWISAFTTGLRVRYGKPMETGVEYTARAEITRRDEHAVRASGELLHGRDLVAAADGTFRLLTEQVLTEQGRHLPSRLVTALRTANQPANQGE
ncbi:PaaI family thioesterase [Streptomyces buecherae]|uniref:PaaI family thioesterase n=1 Tax=Streptomyces buecherae TaxID=2763006 RepID=UPI00368FE307